MKKATKALATAAFVGTLMSWSAGSVLAGFSYEDCPPLSDAAASHLSEKAQGHLEDLLPPEASNINSRAGNLGNKFH